MTKLWDSPYQTIAYAEGLAAVNVPVERHLTPAGDVYFTDGPAGSTAWELDAGVPLDTLQLVDRVAYKMRATPSESLVADAYYTLALDPATTVVANRFMRNVRKARAAMPGARLEVAETGQQLTAVIDAFEAHEERRDGMARDEFGRRIRSLFYAGALLAYAMIDGDTVKGAACVLQSRTQTNLRYYTSDRATTVGHLLHLALIEDLLGDRGFAVVDLSGISPVSGDIKLRGIDEFKHQLGGTVTVFERYGGYAHM